MQHDASNPWMENCNCKTSFSRFLPPSFFQNDGDDSRDFFFFFFSKKFVCFLVNLLIVCIYSSFLMCYLFIYSIFSCVLTRFMFCFPGWHVFYVYLLIMFNVLLIYLFDIFLCCDKQICFGFLVDMLFMFIN